jgi:hypothetical protein
MLKGVIIWIVLLTSLFISFNIAYWVYPTWEVIKMRCPIVIMNPNKKVKRGGFLIYKLTYDKYIDINADLKKVLVKDNVRIPLIDSGVSLPIGKDKSVIIPIFIPDYEAIKPGKYKLHIDATYYPNPLKKKSYKYESEEFTIIK